MKLLMAKGWNADTILGYLTGTSFEIAQDNDGQIVIYTGLFEWSDGSLRDEPGMMNQKMPEGS